MRYGDEFGLFWEQPPRSKDKKELRPLTAIPESTWEPPTDYPSLRDQGIISVDIETKDPDLLERGPGAQRDGYIVGIAIGTEAGFRAYYPVAHAMGANLP